MSPSDLSVLYNGWVQYRTVVIKPAVEISGLRDLRERVFAIQFYF